MLSFFPRGVLDEILNLIGSISEGFPSYSFIRVTLFSEMDLFLRNGRNGDFFYEMELQNHNLTSNILFFVLISESDNNQY